MSYSLSPQRQNPMKECLMRSVTKTDDNLIKETDNQGIIRYLNAYQRLLMLYLCMILVSNHTHPLLVRSYDRRLYRTIHFQHYNKQHSQLNLYCIFLPILVHIFPRFEIMDGILITKIIDTAIVIKVTKYIYKTSNR